MISLDLSDEVKVFLLGAIEEYGVSLFAQQLGTKMPISSKRLEKMWQQLHEQLRRF